MATTYKKYYNPEDKIAEYCVMVLIFHNSIHQEARNMWTIGEQKNLYLLIKICRCLACHKLSTQHIHIH